ncbi:MAG: tyrosine-type recombinase/integrase [Anaerofustis sp.]
MARKTNCVKNGVPYYRTSWTYGKQPNGKPLKKEFYGTCEADANKQKAEFQKIYNSGLNIDIYFQLLAPSMKVWLQTDRMKDSSRERYTSVFNNYVEMSNISQLQIGKINNLTLKAYYRALVKSGKSQSQIEMLNKLLKRFFNYCLEENAIIKNPCAGIRVSSYFRDDVLSVDDDSDLIDDTVPVFDESEVKKIRAALEGNRLKALIYIALGTGARQGELLALRWKDIDMKDKTLRITKTLSKVKIEESYEYIITKPKTKKSVRTVPIPDSVIPVLQDWKIKQTLEKIRSAELYEDNGLVFCTNTGRPVDRRNLLRAHGRILAHAGVEYKKFHAYRHTYATELFNKGVSLKTVSSLLGHSSIKITADIYTFVLEKIKTDEVSKINEMFA